MEKNQIQNPSPQRPPTLAQKPKSSTHQKAPNKINPDSETPKINQASKQIKNSSTILHGFIGGENNKLGLKQKKNLQKTRTFAKNLTWRSLTEKLVVAMK
ncbi:hypothetical protein Syun_020809 [Stephania yunnanensis]|uniref:Uncharacterized protein n=1 Tax=Stephania yunnanensis TaxID=152371 RepID=A0AAP0IEW3_9MAGN